MGPIRLMLAEAGVTEQQWRVLRVLDERGPMTPSAIAAEACLQAPSLTRIVQALFEKGMVARVQDPLERLRQRVTLLSEGRAVIHENLAEPRCISRRIEDQLGAARHRPLMDLLEALNAINP